MTIPYDLYCAALGVFGVGMVNFLQKKPFHAGIYKHLIGGGAGFLLGSQLNSMSLRNFKEKEMVLYDYIAKHPEDFEEPPPKKYKEVLLPWHPVR